MFLFLASDLTLLGLFTGWFDRVTLPLLLQRKLHGVVDHAAVRCVRDRVVHEGAWQKHRM
jgi:hypothetical protein